MSTSTRTKQIAAAGALLLAGAGVGAAVAATGSASAADGGSGTTSTSSSAAPDPSQPQRSDEKLLTGTTATKVRDAALAKYPGATVERVETDSDGVYEAHIVTKAGEHVIVGVGKDFAVTGTQTGGPGGPGGDHDGDGPGTPPAA
ncbi:hypothetical protein [Marmoricola sp. RAF53]|uniref:hypothetical protein n=1 Tax=Marmoricola sp. RAF53 TaxID=3233059 RepID=UPI003F98BFA4